MARCSSGNGAWGKDGDEPDEGRSGEWTEGGRMRADYDEAEGELGGFILSLEGRFRKGINVI